MEVFDYVYGSLHSPSYRHAYAEFLRLDFPRFPWPSSSEQFWNVSNYGASLRELHVMDQKAIGDTPFGFIGDGETVVLEQRFEDGAVWINETQRFEDVPKVAWETYVGGYPPAQK
ncbi:MAG: hypothetical protein OXC84_04325 [Gammaproteobacteria bacterium]|nr:hypothetical protein [Gammaproteobacteria bacterium]